ncbi:MAG: HypC/HybG/HupF family hydrogenase formation chaperone [Phycisphaerae bacterium]|mgnify:CR=1 FL=1|nr:HypC/HybG/HupF family hydrogenase formation chaperone [Phycisphaerae bacterium]
MCLAVPGKIIEVREGDGPVSRVGTVDFQGTRVEVGLSFTPQAGVGDWVLVHAGFALNVLDETEAAETWKYLQEAELVDEIPGELSP